MKRSIWDSVSFGFALAALVALVVFGVPYACTSKKGAIRTLKAAGYADIEITGWRPFMKGDDDWSSTGFKATSPAGERVSGAVTGGLIFKGYTIRTD